MKLGRRIVMIVAVFGVVAIVTAVLVWPRGEREPEYQGKKLSWWIRGASRVTVVVPGSAERKEAVREAVRQIGTNGLPFLVKWIDCGSVPEGKTKIDVAIGRINRKAGHAWIEFRYRKLTRANDAIWAFFVLGDQARPAVPELINLSHSNNRWVACVTRLVVDSITTNGPHMHELRMTPLD